ncbi:MAG: exosortase N [Saprospiraceae bacterium]|nr:exosortase N [Saprospiraceae bacterium]
MYWIMAGYFRSDALFMVGLAAAGGAVVIRQPGVGSRRFAWAAWGFIALSLLVPARSFHFLALVFALLYTLENYVGKINEAPVWIALLLTAGAKTMSIVLGFPLRLQMSENAAQVLQMLGKDARAAGNLILFEGREFLVDSACAGLQMVEVSFLFCFLLWALLERSSGRQLRRPAQGIILLATGMMLLIYNQLRIIFLVIFAIPPEDPMHDAVGLFGLTLYVFLPLYGGLKRAFVSEIWSRAAATKSGHALPVLQRGMTIHTLLPAGILWGMALFGPAMALETQTAPTGFVPRGIPSDCVRETPAPGITKYVNGALLIYIKPVRGWYDTEHTPLICWKGSGYVFGQVQERWMGGTNYYMGVLQKKGAPDYFTAWWFDNGRRRTVSQAGWRWLDMCGEGGFSLVNVTASDPETLEKHLKIMLNNN